MVEENRRRRAGAQFGTRGTGIRMQLGTYMRSGMCSSYGTRAGKQALTQSGMCMLSGMCMRSRNARDHGMRAENAHGDAAGGGNDNGAE